MNSILPTLLTTLLASPALAHGLAEPHGHPHGYDLLMVTLNLLALSGISVLALLAARRVFARRRK